MLCAHMCVGLYVYGTFAQDLSPWPQQGLVIGQCDFNNVNTLKMIYFDI